MSGRAGSPSDADAAATDESWASPAFTPDAGVPTLDDGPYAFGAGRGSSDAARAAAAEPSVDWYEAAALEVVGTSPLTPTSDTEFVGYEETRPPDSATDSPAHPDTDEDQTPASSTALHEPATDDPWAAQAFLDRITSSPREPFKYELGPETAAAAPSAPGGDAGRSSSEDRPDAGGEAWPAVSRDAWPESTSDGWPDSASDDAWSVPELEAPRPARPEAVGPRSEAGQFNPHAVGVGLHSPETPTGAGVSARVSSAAAASDAARPAPPAARSGSSADRDLWQLVGDHPSTGTAPSASGRRSFDPVSIFLTVLVAIVIVALLLGFLVFAAGMLGR